MESLYRSIQHAPKQDQRYSEIQAALGMKKISTLKGRIRQRRTKAELLKSLLPESIRVQQVDPGAEPNYYFFVASLRENAFATRKHLLAHGFDSGIGNEIADNCAPALGFKDCPNIQNIFSRTIHLPIHEGMNNRQLERLAHLLRKRYP